MSNAKSHIIEGVQVIANSLLARAASANDARIPAMVEKLMSKLNTKPDSYFVEKLYPDHGSVDCGASQKVWKELAAEVGKEA